MKQDFFSSNNIKYIDYKDVDILKKKYTEVALKYLEHNLCWTDTGMEALLTLILLDQKYLIKKEWIKTILKHQQADGAWKFDDAALNTHQHPTILALWILLSIH